MSIVIESFPKLNKELLAKIGHTIINNKYSYYDNGVNCPLEAENTETSNSRLTIVKLTDPTSKWHPETHTLNISVAGSINMPLHLFGANGIVSKNNGRIGIAVLWMSRDSSMRGIEPVDDFSNQFQPFEYSKQLLFPAHTLRGTLVLRTIIYLKQAGNLSSDEMHLTTVTGTILGILDETRIIIDGNGSVFPVVEKADKTMPLWWVDCSWEDPTEDLLVEENFCLYLNTAHADYPSLSLNNGLKNAPLFQDIIASSISIMITEVLSDDAYRTQTITGSGLLPGSISSAVNYFLKIYEVDTGLVNHQALLAKSIRQKLMARF